MNLEVGQKFNLLVNSKPLEIEIQKLTTQYVEFIAKGEEVKNSQESRKLDYYRFIFFVKNTPKQRKEK